ncbi:MAG: dTDP-4-dehydrorhamnose reductase [Acidobacteriota bacterium]|nr:dTDP-4-dehydrorhamnose reductase [Acidobacteriota bacterium]
MPLPTNPARILLSGASGQIGGELLHTLAPLGEVIAPSRTEMDLADTASIRTFIRAARPLWIVNAAAYTAVDQAESEPALAFTLNAEALRTIGTEARELDATVLHFSTDYVFNGHSSRPYIETDSTDPINVYGASKLAGEQALAETGAQSFILRTSWVYGATGNNFLRTILKLARERDTLRIVGDQRGAPTWSRDLARMTAHVIAHCEQTSTPVSDFTGIYHATANGETTWAAFAAEALRQLHQREPTAKFATITPIATADYTTAALRPANSRMSNEKLFRTFNYRMMDWRESLPQVLAELA